MNSLISCTEPRKDRRRFSVDCGGIAKIASVLFSSGDIPVWVKSYPSHSFSVFAKRHFED